MQVDLKLAPEELAGVIEALHDGILKRMRWSAYISDEYKMWRELPLETVQTVLDNFVSAYTKAVMLYRESDFGKSELFESRFVFHDDVWDLLATITTAESWDEIEFHNVHLSHVDCEVCKSVFNDTGD